MGMLFQKWAEIAQALHRWEFSEPLKDIGLSPAGAGRRYGIIVQNNPVNKIDPSGLFDIYFQMEADLVAGWIGFEWGLGIVFDASKPAESGIFQTSGPAGGGNAGFGWAGFGFALRDIEGSSLNYDFNLGLWSVIFSKDEKGCNGIAFSYGPGGGASVSYTNTTTYTFKDLWSSSKKYFNKKGKSPCK